MKEKRRGTISQKATGSVKKQTDLGEDSKL
jgi:hypothetical protein